MTGFFLDLRQTLRSLRKTGTIVLIALITIALGVGANTAMFSIVNAVILSPLPYPEPERLVSLWPEKRWSLPMVNDVTQRVSSYTAISAYRSETFSILGGDAPEAVTVGVVSPTHFDVLGISPRTGRAFVAADAASVEGASVILGHDFWQRRFGGDPRIVGQQIRLAGAGAESRTVIGIMPPGFTPFPGGADAWVPLVSTPGQPGYYGSYGVNVIARLRSGVTAQAALPELRRLVPELTPMHPTQFRPIRYSPVDVVPLRDQMTKGVRTQLIVLLGAVGFILLIACTNVANLLLARAHGRQREVAVQMALGCSRGRVVRQVLTESLVVGVGGGAIGVAIAVFSVPAIRSLVAGQVPRTTSIDVDLPVLIFAGALSLLAALLFGSMPALHAARSTPAAVMRATAGRGQSQGRAAGRVNDTLVVAEIALSLMLLAGAGLMLKSLWKLTQVDLGMRTERVMTLRLSLPPRRYDSIATRLGLLRQMEERLGAVPGVEAIGTIDYLPLTGQGAGFPYRVEGQDLPPGSSQVVSTRVVTPGYFAALGIPLLRGRMLGPQDIASSENVLVINEAFAKQHWENGDPIGARIVSEGSGDPIGRIVGIVRDTRGSSAAEEPQPEMYASVDQFGWAGTYMLVRGSTATPSAKTLTDVLRSIDPDLAVRSAQAMEDVVRASMGTTRFYTGLLTGFAALALVLGLVGVYGVMAYAASRRTREFGVRLALGATTRDLMITVMARAMAPVAIGVMLGIGGALTLTRFLGALLYGVEATDPWVLGGVALLMVSAAAIAAMVPAARAAHLSPVSALQAE